MVAVVFIMAIVLVGGYFISFAIDENSPVIQQLARGAFIGITAWGLIGLLFASVVKDLPVWIPIITSLLIFAVPLGLVRSKKKLNKKHIGDWLEILRQKLQKPARKDILVLVFYIGIFIFFHFISSSAFFLRDGEYFTRYSDNYSDATLHSGIVAGFAYGGNFPPMHPDFAGTKLSYPFLINFIAAMLVVLGLRIDQAFYLQYMWCFVLLTLLLKQWSYTLVKNTLAAYLTPLIIFFSGGFGFAIFIKEWWLENNRWEFLLHLPHEYTNYEELIRWGNSLINWFIPMRSLLLGVPLATIVFLWWWRILQSKEIDWQLVMGAGFVSGLIPLAHTHSYLVVIGVSFVWAVLFRKIKPWIVFGVISLILALPQLLWIKLGSQADFGTFFGVMNGWVRGETNFFWFWLANTGIFIPLLLVVFLFPKLLNSKLKKYFLPFLLLFFLGNFLRVTPWDWDNNKILLYWFIPCSILIAYMIATLWQRGKMQKLGAVLVLFILIFSGGLDLFRVIVGVNNWVVFDRATIAMAKEIKKLPPKSVIVSAPYINNPVLLSGRYTYMGYTGRLWTHGLSYTGREEKVQKIYEGNEVAFATEQFDYIILGDAEKNWMTDRFAQINQPFFDSLNPITQVEDRILYQISRQ